MTIEIRLTTPDRLAEVLASGAEAVGLGQEGCLTKLPATDELRAAADRVRAAGRTVVVVAPIAWPRTAGELHRRLLAVAEDGPTTVTVNDLGTAMTMAGVEGCTLVAGLGLTRSRPNSADLKTGTPHRAGVDTSLLAVLAEYGVSAVEVDTDTEIAGRDWQVRQLVDAVPVGYGRSCPTARQHRTGPPDCRALCDTPFQITANGRWQLNHGHREPLPVTVAPPALTVWGNAVYQPATSPASCDYRIIDARWHSADSLAAAVSAHRDTILIGH
jgi:hypothetical protein